MIYRPDACLARWVDHNRLGANALDGAVLCCYATNRTWLSTDDTANATAIESAFAGYARQTITDWGAAAVSGNIATTTAGLYTFTATGVGLPSTQYGIFVLDSGGNLLYVEVNPTGGVTLSGAGQQFSYRPAWSDKNI